MYLNEDLELFSDASTAGLVTEPDDASMETTSAYRQIFAAPTQEPTSNQVSAAYAKPGAKSISIFQQATHVAPPMDRILATFVDALLPARSGQDGAQSDAQTVINAVADALPPSSVPTTFVSVLDMLGSNTVFPSSAITNTWDASAIFCAPSATTTPAPVRTPRRTASKSLQNS